MTILLVGGDSWTDPDSVKDNWAEQLVNETDMLLINKAKVGYGNQAIFETLIEEIQKHKGKIKQLVVCWSASDRYDIEVYNNYLMYHGYSFKDENTPAKTIVPCYAPNISNMYNVLDKQFTDVDNMLEVFINKTLRYAWLLEQICDKEGIPIIQFNGIDYIFESEHYKLYGKKLDKGIKNKVVDIIKKSKYKMKTYLGLDIAWCWDEELRKIEKDEDISRYRVGYNRSSNWYMWNTGKLNFDWHPNKLGHTVIKDIIKNKISYK